MNKNIASFIFMVTTILLYDLLFDLTWLFPQGCHYIFYVVGAVLCFHVVIAAISQAFPKFSRLPLSLYIPSNSHVPTNKAHSTGAWHVLHNKIVPNLSVLERLLPLLLCLFLLQFKVRQVHNTNLYNLFYSVFTLMCIIVTLVVLLYWEIVYKICPKPIFKYNRTLNYLLETTLFPAVIILKLLLCLLDPVYKTCLNVKPLSKFSLVQYFWSLTSKFFLSIIMITCLFLFHGILLNFDTTQNLVLVHKLRSAPMYLVPFALILTISALPYPFLVGSFVISIIAVGENFNASYRHTTEMPLVFPILYLFLGLLLSYSSVKMVELYHPGFLLSVVFRSKRFVTSILVVDITGKSHSFTFAPHATIFDLRSQINSKFNLTSDLYWLSGCCKPLHDFIPLNEITGAVIMNGRLIGGVQCCLMGCENEAGTRKFDSMIGQYEIKCSPHDLTGDMENVKNLRVCDKHYVSLSSRGHKPAKGKGSSKSRSDAQRGILKVNPCVVTCLQCSNEVCLSSDIPCKRHNIRVFDKLFSVACNFLDEQNGSKTDFHNDLYISTERYVGSNVCYICMSCQPFFLKSVKIEAEYKKAKIMFEEKQECSNPSSWSDLAVETKQHSQGEIDHSMNPSSI